jgi:hypothetical protein
LARQIINGLQKCEPFYLLRCYRLATGGDNSTYLSLWERRQCLRLEGGWQLSENDRPSAKGTQAHAAL